MAQVLAFKRVVNTALLMKDSGDLYRALQNMRNFIQERKTDEQEETK